MTDQDKSPAPAGNMTVDAICDEFERARKADHQTSIEQMLTRVPEELQATLFRELLRLDVDYNIQSSQAPDSADLKARFPQYAEIVGDVLAEFDQTIGADYEQTGVSSVDHTGDATVIGPVGDNATPAVGQADSEDLPSTIGKYIVEGFLGRGAFGSVYLAKAPDDPSHVAIKVLRSERTTSESREQFNREADALQEVCHPGIVNLEDRFVTDDGTLCLALEYVSGGTLKSRIGEPRTFVQTANFIAQLAEALHELHLSGATHRDVKPENILLDADGNPKLADVGLALPDYAYGKGHQTIAGSLAYMSPEQARGDSHLVDGRADIYSLGVVLYQMLTGRKPFSADDQSELLRRIQQISIKPPRQINGDVPGALESICLKATAKDPEDRYPTGVDFAADLRQFASGRPAGIWSALLPVSLIGIVLLIAAFWIYQQSNPADSPDNTSPEQSSDEPPSDSPTEIEPSRLLDLKARLSWIQVRRPGNVDSESPRELAEDEFARNLIGRTAEIIRSRLRDAEDCISLIEEIRPAFSDDDAETMESLSQPLSEKLSLYRALLKKMQSPSFPTEQLLADNRQLGVLSERVDNAAVAVNSLIDAQLGAKTPEGPIEVLSFDVLVTRDGSSFAEVDSVLPLQPGDGIRFSVTLSRKAFAKLYWVDAKNQFTEFYPQQPDGESQPEEAASVIQSPANLSEAWSPLDPAGLSESVFLVVSDEPLNDLDIPQLDASAEAADPPVTVRRFNVTRGEKVVALQRIGKTRSLGASKVQVKDSTRLLLDEMRNRADLIHALQIPMLPSEEQE